MLEQHKSFVIFASGEGTNAEALIRCAQKNKFKVCAVISDREAPVLSLAEKLGVPAKLIPHKDEKLLLNTLAELKPRWAFLAGYKKMIGTNVLKFFFDAEKKFSRILNIHPSLLPAYPGLDGYRRAFEDGVKVSGVTVHLVDAGLDTGPPVLQKEFRRDANDTLEAFTAKGKAIEHQIYPEALLMALNDRISEER